MRAASHTSTATSELRAGCKSCMYYTWLNSVQAARLTCTATSELGAGRRAWMCGRHEVRAAGYTTSEISAGCKSSMYCLHMAELGAGRTYYGYWYV